MTTKRIDHTFTRGDAWKPGVLELYTLAADGITKVPLPVSATSGLICTVRKKPAVAELDDTDANVVGQISATPGPHGAISVVAADAVQLLFHGSITKTWNTQNEYFYDVQCTLLADGEPYTPVKGSLTPTWSVTQTG